MLYNPPPRNEIKKIAVLMYGLLGDTLIRTPLLRELRVLYCDAVIVAFADQAGKNALDLTNLTDEIIVLDRRKKRFRLDVLARIGHFLKLRLGSYDLIIDLYMGQTSQLMARYGGARYKIFAGFEQTMSNWVKLPLALTHYNFKNPYHCSNFCLNALGFLTTSHVSLSTRPALDVNRLRSTLRSQDIKKIIDTESFFLVSLGSGDPRKVPDLSKVLAVCSYTFRETGFIPIAVKNPGQEHLQASLVAGLTKAKIPFQALNYLTLEQISSLMLKARFVILPDSGLFHIATGLGVNILALFTYTNPELVRPDAENCTIVFEPDDLCRSETNGLPFGAGTPSTDELLSITSSFLARLESREAYVASHN